MEIWTRKERNLYVQTRCHVIADTIFSCNKNSPTHNVLFSIEVSDPYKLFLGEFNILLKSIKKRWLSQTVFISRRAHISPHSFSEIKSMFSDKCREYYLFFHIMVVVIWNIYSRLYTIFIGSYL